MSNRMNLCIAAVCVVAIGLAGAASTSRPEGEPVYTTDFRLQDAALLPVGANPYWSLQPFRTWHYEGEDGGELVRLRVRVLPFTKWIKIQLPGGSRWVLTRIVEEREWVGDELVEISWNYLARDLLTRNVYYFGEDVNIYENGQVVSHEGAWLAGVNGAKPGLIMPSVFLLGSRYFQEMAPDVAMDRAEHIESGVTLQTPAGTFHNCIVVRETTPLEPGAEGIKVYAPGVGLVKDGFLELVEVH